MPTISVIIPVYNGEATLAETVESILRQTFTDFELLIINDGSTDRTPEIASSFRDSRIRIHTFENRGLSASRNRGISLAKGEYLSFIDADDCWTADKLECQLRALKDQPGADVAYSWTAPFDRRRIYLAKQVYHQGNVFQPLLLCNFVGSGSNVLLTRKAVRETGLFDETLKACEDWDYYLRLAKRYRYALVPKPQILYRVASTSMSSKTDALIHGAEAVLKRALETESLPPLIRACIYKSAIHITLGRSRGEERTGNLKVLAYLRQVFQCGPAVIFRREFLALVLKVGCKLSLPEPLYDQLILWRDESRIRLLGNRFCQPLQQSL